MRERGSNERVDSISVEVVVKTPSAKCEILVESILPDEGDYPEGFNSTCRCEDDVFVYRLVAELKSPTDVLTVKNVLNEILEHVKLIESLLKLRG